MQIISIFLLFLPANPASDPTPPTRTVPATALPTEKAFFLRPIGSTLVDLHLGHRGPL
ncbi:hypothetical protein [Lactobacillus johnsonii]|uniref:Uncharacterized protein n=1 Tax=Lactobacillus johnsonii TaxID=33959 RepID=A0AAW5LYZ8_LACJH|nr:hypothetical protein [Lactobacillus johnsonii]MCR1915256.1 hypothetical protein [Lactobacillus johnsonii]